MSEKKDKKRAKKVGEFIRNHGTAHGGNWTAMFMSAIRDGLKETFEKMEDKEYSFEELYDIIDKEINSLDGWFSTSGGDATTSE